MNTSTSQGKHGIQWTARMQLNGLDFTNDLPLLSHARQQLQLLFERQFESLVKLRTQLLNHSCFEDATEVDGLISQLHTELENDCSFHESSTNRISNDTPVTQDPPSGPVLFISETWPVMDSNSIIPETACADSDLSYSQTDALLNVRRIVAVTAHETENKSSSTLNATAPNGSHHSAKDVSDKSNYRDSLLPENMSDASNDDQKLNTILKDADYFDDPLSTNEVPNKFGHNISEESNFDYLISSVVQPHHLVTFSRLSVQCDKYVLNKLKLIVTWEYEDPTLFRGEGMNLENLKSRYQCWILKKGEVC
ncbi:unnamed protein product [Schistosoma margrebowiei]|uniref:Uncharacterized protein n=1 Tax=Schistosoma margrebowiei TaxID=48269 RepID=A0A183LF44_9TREM|nr:unnamed protein product [Schistosoma margrebowiei]